jgi:PilZ domain
MITHSKTASCTDKLMNRLMDEAESEFNDDRRATPRFPFVRPVAIQLDGKTMSAFTRDISASSIGLLHNMALPLTEIQIMVSGQQYLLSAQVERCDACGEGWYVSGCTIIRRDF